MVPCLRIKTTQHAKLEASMEEEDTRVVEEVAHRLRTIADEYFDRHREQHVRGERRASWPGLLYRGEKVCTKSSRLPPASGVAVTRTNQNTPTSNIQSQRNTRPIVHDSPSCRASDALPPANSRIRTLSD